MKWPFARHAARAAPSSPAATAAPPARREWATLPPMPLAGERPIRLTAAPSAFVDGLAARATLVRTPRLEHVRHVDAPSGSLRGVLATEGHDAGPADQPPTRDPSPLPEVEHRRVTPVPVESGPVEPAAGADDRRAVTSTGPSPVEQLLAIGSSSDVPEASPTGAPERPPALAPAETGPRSGLADSRRRGLGPAYHGPLPEAISAERERADGASDSPPSGTSSLSTTEPVPAGVRATLRDVVGFDVGDRLVHRGPAVSAEAQSMGAEAFTRDGQVFVADDVGPLDELRGRATLAHELTHAAQQLTRGIVDERSAAGRLHEAHAQQVEQYVRGDGGATKPGPALLHARPPEPGARPDADLAAETRHMMRELVDTGLARADGDGGIVFTMPPSAMTAVTGTQRLTAAAPAAEPGPASRQEHWDGAAVFGNTLAQGLSNDLLGVAGSMFGFSDEVIGEQRGELADANREFAREQTKRAFAALRMDHLRAAELGQRNASEALAGIDRSMALDDDTLRSIDRGVHDEVERRMRLLDDQRDRALQQLNEARRASRETLLTEFPDERYDAAFHQLFDHPDRDEVPSETELLTMLTQSTGSPGGRGGGGATRNGAARTTPPSTGSPPAGRASPAPAPTRTGSGGSETAGAGGDAQPWRTESTMGGRFEALGNALLGDVANDQIENIGSVFGFDERFEQSIHDDIDASTRPAAATSAARDAAPDVTSSVLPSTAAPAHSSATQPAAHETIDRLVDDPYALDELASRLYPNIRSRLRHELLIDRERAGLLADFR